MSSDEESPEKRDLRFTSADSRGVRVDRDMSGQGHLARGSHTNMSNMRFSVKAQPRKELDPELLALRPEPAAEVVEVINEKSLDLPVNAAASEKTSDEIVGEDQRDGGLLASIKRLFT